MEVSLGDCIRAVPSDSSESESIASLLCKLCQGSLSQDVRLEVGENPVRNVLMRLSNYAYYPETKRRNTWQAFIEYANQGDGPSFWASFIMCSFKTGAPFSRTLMKSGNPCRAPEPKKLCCLRTLMWLGNTTQTFDGYLRGFATRAGIENPLSGRSNIFQRTTIELRLTLTPNDKFGAKGQGRSEFV